jgi:hypothetical protein
MTDVQFNEESYGIKAQAPHARARGLADYMVQKGITKTEPQANLLLIAGAIVLLAVTGWNLLRLQSPGDSYGNYVQLRAEQPELFQNPSQ